MGVVVEAQPDPTYQISSPQFLSLLDNMNADVSKRALASLVMVNAAFIGHFDFGATVLAECCP